MKYTLASIPDIIIVEPDFHADHRGFFMETWEKKKYKECGINAEFVQDNHSKSVYGILRGLHYQIVQPQGKLVRVIFGEIYDVAVDLRKYSPTYGKWIGEYLSAENRKICWIPEGFAHGFYVVSDIAEVCYKCTDYYIPQHERTIIWNDPDLNIQWPIAGDHTPLLSEKDSNGLPFREAEAFD